MSSSKSPIASLSWPVAASLLRAMPRPFGPMRGCARCISVHTGPTREAAMTRHELGPAAPVGLQPRGAALRVREIDAWYDAAQILRGERLQVGPGEAVGQIGR